MKHRTNAARHQAPGERRTRLRPVTVWSASALVLVALSVGVVVSAVTGDDGDGDSSTISREAREQQQALEDDVAENSRPTDGAVSTRINAELEAAVTEVSEQYNVQIGISVRAAGGVVHAGELQEIPAWSSVKVPVAVAATQRAMQDGTVDDIADDVDSAITVSDNDAALRLWETLGDTDEDSARYLDSVLRQAGDPTQTVADRDLPAYEGFGDDRWTLDNQVIFADRLACLTGSEQVLDAMGRIADEHRRGVGQLPGVLFKGGWGSGDDGTYLLREFGLAGAEGARVPFATAVDTPDGSDETARDAMADLAGRLDPVIADAAGAGGAADCQPRSQTPDDQPR